MLAITPIWRIIVFMVGMFLTAAPRDLGLEIKMKKVYTIKQKMSGTGSIHDIASDLFDRDIVFAPGCLYAVVLSSYYGGKGYSTHKTEAAAIAASNKQKDLSHAIIDSSGDRYYVYYDRLVKA